MNNILKELKGYYYILLLYIILYNNHYNNSMKATIDCGPPRAHPFTNKREQDKVFINLEIRLINILLLSLL